MNKNIIVILDTSVLRKIQDLDSIHMQSLINLAKKGLLKIKLPYIIYKEFISYLEEEHNKTITQLEKIEKFFNNNKWLHNDYSQYQFINKTLIQLQNLIEINFIEWCKRNFIELLPFNELHCNKVIENYFNGNSPFKSIKSRKDIPDAFIYEEIKQICKANIIYFLTKDNNFKEHCKKLQNIYIFDSIEELIKYEEIQRIILKDKIIEFKDNIPEKLSFYRDKIRDTVYTNLKEEQINNSLLGSEININDCLFYIYDNAYIQYIEFPEEISIHFEKAYYLSKNEIAIPIDLVCSGNIEIYIFKSDYYAQMEYISASEWNDHYFLTEEQIYLLIETNLIINIDKLNENNIEIDNVDEEITEEMFIDNLEISIEDNYNIKDVFCNGYFSFTCNKCNKTHIINCDLLDWEEVERNEREMGLETHKEASLYETCSCGNNIEITFHIWEYPIGSIDYTEIESKGTNKANIDLNCNFEPNDNYWNK